VLEVTVQAVVLHELTSPFVSETAISPAVAPVTSAIPEGVHVLAAIEFPIALMTQLVPLVTDMASALKLAEVLVFAKASALPPIGTRFRPQSAVLRAAEPL
jgi:hypothetical protein